MSPRNDHDLPLGARLLPGVDLSLWFGLLTSFLVVGVAVALPLLILLRR